MASKNKKAKKSNGSIWSWIIGGIVAVVLIVLFYFGATGTFFTGEKPEDDVTTQTTTQTETNDTTATQEQVPAENSNVKTYDEIPEGHPVATITMENGEKIVAELYPEYAPQTVANFVYLAESGFYDGLTFHRIVDGFMAQGGDPEGTGMGGSEHNIVGEFSGNGFAANTLSHTRGVISMARSQAPDSASSQFFICYDDASFLDGQYAAFGKVIEGMETVDAFLQVERTANEMGEAATPVEPVIMKSVTIER